MNFKSQYRLALVTLHAERDSDAIPLGAACIAAAVRREFGVEAVREFRIDPVLLDFSVSEDPVRVANEIRRENPNLVGFSLYCWNRTMSERVARELRRTSPELTLFAGGPDVEWYRRSGNECPFGTVFLRSAESAVVNWLSGRFRGEDGTFRIIDQDSQSVDTLASPWLDGIIMPRERGTVMWELSRGCSYRCAYCYEGRGIAGVAHFPMKRIERELDIFIRSGVGKVFLLDPTFNIQRTRAIDLLGLFSKKGKNIYWYFEVRAELLDEGQARAFANLSCSLQIGLQSAHPDVLKTVGRDIDRKKFVRKLALLDAEGVVFGLDLIYGLPRDSLEGFRESLDFAISLGPNHLDIFPLSVLPGTNLFERKAELGLKCQEEPPYLLEEHDSFSREDMKKAASIAEACRVFYSEGRAVPWFNAVLKPLGMRPSLFFESLGATERGLMENHRKIEEFQLNSIESFYDSARLGHLIPVVSDLVRYNGALSRAAAERERTTLKLSYPPHFLESIEVLDIFGFSRHAKKRPGLYDVFPGSQGPEIRRL
jgi:hypothetical protein